MKMSKFVNPFKAVSCNNIHVYRVLVRMIFGEAWHHGRLWPRECDVVNASKYFEEAYNRCRLIGYMSGIESGWTKTNGKY